MMSKFCLLQIAVIRKLNKLCDLLEIFLCNSVSVIVSSKICKFFLGGAFRAILIFSGNHYGTPKPPKEPTLPLVRRSNSIGLPGGQSKVGTEGHQRKRSRSGSEMVPEVFEDEYVQPFTRKKSLERAHSSSNLGPLPANWEMAFTEDGHPYFIE